MENKNMPAYPQPIAECNGGLSETMEYNSQAGGLSKRELISAMAMSGFLASFAGCLNNPKVEIVAAESVKYADALLTELSNT